MDANGVAGLCVIFALFIGLLAGAAGYCNGRLCEIDKKNAQDDDAA